MVNTFLPYASFAESARVLDYRRLGKQRSEAIIILNTLEGRSQGWKHHPALKMWRGYEDALRMYFNIIVLEWVWRSYKNNMSFLAHSRRPTKPFWLGNKRFHDSHRANLLAKDFEFYSQYGWGVEPKRGYFWPITVTGG